jgi:hypothetical protein
MVYGLGFRVQGLWILWTMFYRVLLLRFWGVVI